MSLPIDHHIALLQRLYRYRAEAPAVQCPLCAGEGEIFDATTGEMSQCPDCAGEGTVPYGKLEQIKDREIKCIREAVRDGEKVTTPDGFTVDRSHKVERKAVEATTYYATEIRDKRGEKI